MMQYISNKAIHIQYIYGYDILANHNTKDIAFSYTHMQK